MHDCWVNNTETHSNAGPGDGPATPHRPAWRSTTLFKESPKASHEACVKAQPGPKGDSAWPPPPGMGRSPPHTSRPSAPSPQLRTRVQGELMAEQGLLRGPEPPTPHPPPAWERGHSSAEVAVGRNSFLKGPLSHHLCSCAAGPTHSSAAPNRDTCMQIPQRAGWGEQAQRTRVQGRVGWPQGSPRDPGVTSPHSAGISRTMGRGCEPSL